MALEPIYKHLIQLAGFTAACIGIYSFAVAPSERLEADIYFTDFELPAVVAQQMRALEPLTAFDTARKEFMKGVGATRLVPGTIGAVDQVLNNVVSYVNQKVPVVEHRDEFLFKGYWRIAVRNSGSRTASTVVLHLPVPASAVVSRPQDNPVAIQQLTPVNSQAVPVGNVQGGEELVVYAWTLAQATDQIAKKITVSHDVGTARIKILH